MDVASAQPPSDLLSAMQHVAERDLIAKQYVTGFCFLLDDVVPMLTQRCAELGLTIGIVDTSVRLLSRQPDSLIRRKCGESIAKQASDLAAYVLEAGDPHGEEYANRLAALDFWLRADGNRRNPGTSADMITAAIFVCLLDARLDLSE
jgi:triphosphoribosyl-dephospho-CoA synthase